MRRIDGKKIKNLEPYEKIMPIIMKDRVDSLVYYTDDIPIDNILRYTPEQEKKYSYLNIIYTALIRTIKEKEKLNRFVINGRVYQRNNIVVSMVVKPRLDEKSEEEVAKLEFTGDETLAEVSESLNDYIAKIKEKEKNKANINNDSKSTQTDILAQALNKIPVWILKIGINTLMFLDKINLMPKKIIEASPFHASAFITNVGSIGLDAIYHHIYNFGTIGMFLSIGKKHDKVVLKDGKVITKKCIKISIVCDERICDGYYFAQSIKYFKRLLKNPELLEKKDITIDETEELEEALDIELTLDPEKLENKKKTRLVSVNHIKEILQNIHIS